MVTSNKTLFNHNIWVSVFKFYKGPIRVLSSKLVYLKTCETQIYVSNFNFYFFFHQYLIHACCFQADETCSFWCRKTMIKLEIPLPGFNSLVEIFSSLLLYSLMACCYQCQRQVIWIDRISLKTLKLLCRKFSDLFPPTLTRSPKKKLFSFSLLFSFYSLPFASALMWTESKMQSQALHKGTHTAHIV